LGLCGTLDNSIYSRLLDRVNRERQIPSLESIFYSGIDWGQMKSATTCIFGFTNENRDYKVVLDEYYHSNDIVKKMG
jgi:hypothetical protein